MLDIRRRAAIGAPQQLPAKLKKLLPDQDWFEFRRQLACKLTRRGDTLPVVPPQYMSQTCTNCG